MEKAKWDVGVYENLDPDPGEAERVWFARGPYRATKEGAMGDYEKLLRVAEAAEETAGLIVAGYDDEIAAKKELLAALATLAAGKGGETKLDKLTREWDGTLNADGTPRMIDDTKPLHLRGYDQTIDEDAAGKGEKDNG